MKKRPVKKLLLLSLLLCLSAINLRPALAASCTNDKQANNCIEVAVVDANEQAQADVVVYLMPLDGQQLNEQAPIVTIAQKDKAFAPYISVSQRNQQVDFVNQDDITHHIYSVNSENNFAFKIKKDEAYTINSFDNSAAMAMGCNIHDWMSGHLLIVDTPYFGKTDALGKVRFNLQQLGRYQITVWHPQLPTQDNRVQQTELVSKNASYQISLPKPLLPIPSQESSEDFDFISDY